MRRLALYLTLVLSLMPSTSSALNLSWSSGITDLTFSEATRCTLVVQASPGEASGPGDWQLRWVVEGCELSPVVTTTCDSSVADVDRVIDSVAPVDWFGNVITVELCSREIDSHSTARYVFDLPPTARGRIQAVALDPTDPDSSRTTKSPIVTINGGLPDSLPPVILHTRTAHHSTEFTLSATGVGLSDQASILLVGLSNSWQLPLEVVSQTDTLLVARAQLAAHVPQCMLAIMNAAGAAQANAVIAGDPEPPLLDALGASCQRTYEETIYPLTMIQPKDFAFVLGGWTPSGVWVHHLFYIRQNQETKAHHGGIDFTEKNIGHAKSNDLVSWPMAEVDTAAIKVRPGMFDSKHVWAPYIVKRGLIYNMFYTGVADDGDQAIGLATSTDLVTWTQRVAPVFTDAQLSAWASPRGPLGTDPAQLRDPFVMPDPANPGLWLLYFVTIPSDHTNAQIVGVARSNGDFTQWSNDFPLYSTLHPYPGPGQFEADVESPTVFQYQGKWWLWYSIREIRPIWAISNPLSPIDQNAANWSQAVDTNEIIIDEFTGQPTGAYFYWHGAEFLQVNASQNITFLGGWDDQQVGISYIAVKPAEPPYLFEEHCPVSTTDVGGQDASFSEPRLSVVGARVVRGEMKVRVELVNAMRVQLAIYDVRGRRVKVLADGELPPGVSDLAWDGRSETGTTATSGVYFARLEVGTFRRFARGVLIH